MAQLMLHIDDGRPDWTRSTPAFTAKHIQYLGKYIIHIKDGVLIAHVDRRRISRARGYKIKKFKVDRNCYEIYGHNKDGKKLEIYYDTRTLDVVKSEFD